MAALYEKLLGCIAATRVGSAMGAPVEGWSMEKIAGTYGVLEHFEPYHHYSNVTDWVHPAGSTEDGIERQKLMCLCIIEKQDRITAEDLVATWLKILDPEKMVCMTEKFDRDLLAIAKSGITPAGELGRFCRYLHLNTTARSFHAIPMINAGDIPSTIRDMYDVGRVYQPIMSDSYPFGASYNAAVSHAFTKDATVESVIQIALKYANPAVSKLLTRDLRIAEKYDDPLSLRDEFSNLYVSKDVAYDQSRIHETVCKSLAIFSAAKGDPKKSIIAAVNFGRDTDCLAASAGGLAGAFSGVNTLPQDWVKVIDDVTKDHPYTNSHLTIEETANGMFQAFKNKIDGMKRYVSISESAILEQPEILQR